MTIVDLVSYVVPASWDQYLRTGDATGLDQAEREAAAAWRAKHDIGGWTELGSSEDAGLCTEHDGFEFWPVAVECRRYSALAYVSRNSGIDHAVELAIQEREEASQPLYRRLEEINRLLETSTGDDFRRLADEQMDILLNQLPAIATRSDPPREYD